MAVQGEEGVGTSFPTLTTRLGGKQVRYPMGSPSKLSDVSRCREVAAALVITREQLRLILSS